MEDEAREFSLIDSARLQLHLSIPAFVLGWSRRIASLSGFSSLQGKLADAREHLDKALQLYED